MEEALISFNIAKLAKEKGYNITNYLSYDENTGIMLPKSPGYPGWHCYSLEGVCPAPTQSLLQKWLRKKHNIFLTVTCDGRNKYDYHGYDVDITKSRYETDEYPGFEIGSEKCRFTTYEEALEIGLLEALKLI